MQFSTVIGQFAYCLHLTALGPISPTPVKLTDG